MKRKLLGLLLVGAVFFTVGCGKKEEKKVEDTTPKIVCTGESSEDGMKSTTTTTITIRDDKKYVKDYISEIKMVVDDETMYNLYKEAMKSELEAEKDEDVEYSINNDDANKTITVVMKASVTDERLNKASDEEKKEMEVKEIIKETEKAGVTCEYKNITKEELGL
jgi:hypothetical protein